MPTVSESQLENILYRCANNDMHERDLAQAQLEKLLESEALRHRDRGNVLPLSKTTKSMGLLDILLEAARCIQCENRSCQVGKTESGQKSGGCPLGLRIPEFIHAIRQGDIRTAHRILMDDNPLHWATARICSKDSPCQASCALSESDGAISIWQLERTVGDIYRKLFGAADDCLGRLPDAKDFPIAVIGSGPAGLSTAIFLARRDYSRIYVFEPRPQPGGVLRYGAAPYRLPTKTLDEIMSYIERLGVKIIGNTAVSRTLTLDDLQQKGFRAFYLEATLIPEPNSGKNQAGVFRSNNAATDAETIILSMADGKKAAAEIDRYLDGLSEDAAMITVDPRIEHINN